MPRNNTVKNKYKKEKITKGKEHSHFEIAEVNTANTTAQNYFLESLSVPKQTSTLNMFEWGFHQNSVNKQIFRELCKSEPSPI